MITGQRCKVKAHLGTPNLVRLSKSKRFCFSFLKMPMLSSGYMGGSFQPLVCRGPVRLGALVGTAPVHYFVQQTGHGGDGSIISW